MSTLTEIRRTRARPPVTPETRERLRAAAKARWADPDAGAQLRAAIRNPNSRARISEAMKARWADPAAREKLMSEKQASLADPVVRQRMSSAAKVRWADPSAREKFVASMRGNKKRRSNKALVER